MDQNKFKESIGTEKLEMRVPLTRGVIRLLLVLLSLVGFVSLLLLSSHYQLISDNINLHSDDNYLISDLEIKTCSFFTGGCSSRDGWFRIPKSLNYRSNGRLWSRFSKQYLFVKKVPINSVKSGTRAITNFKVQDTKERWSYNLDKYDSNHEEKFFYNVDVLFGLDAVDPRPEWKLIKQPLHGIQGKIPVYLTFKTKRTNYPLPKIDLKVKSKNYKILQVADLHFSTFEGVCRDQYPEVENCKADKRTLTFLNKVLDLENPDLVVLTGDQIFGEDSFDSITTMFKVLSPFIEREIPYAFMFGNHDDEGSLTREEILDLVATLPYNIASHGPKDISGVGNYAFQIKEQNSELAALTMYVLDSHKYSPKPRTLPGYDWLKEDQLEYITKKHDVLRKNESGKHLSFAFFHIPLPEYKNTDKGFTGNYKEAITAPKYNTGGRDVLQKIGISVVSVGHDHCNDYCLLDSKSDADNDKLWLCYGGGSGEGGYGGYGGTTRRLRIFTVDTESKKVESYKRLETSPSETFDHQILVQ